MSQSNIAELHETIQQCFPYLDKKLKQSPPKIQVVDNSEQNIAEYRNLQNQINELQKQLKVKEDEVLRLSTKLLKLQKVITFSKAQQDLVRKENENLCMKVKEMKLKSIQEVEEEMHIDLVCQNNNVYNFLFDYRGKHPFFDSLLVRHNKNKKITIQQFVKYVDQQLNYHQRSLIGKNRYSQQQRPLKLHSKYFTSPKQLSPINLSNNNLTTDGEDNLKYRSYSFQSH